MNRKHLSRNGLLTAVFAMFVFLPALGGTARADWFWTHGHSGVIEDASVVASAVARGGGLSVSLQNNTSTWIHFAVPTVGQFGYGAQYIKLIFNVDQALDSRISQVDVYNGDILVASLPVDWKTAGANAKTLNLGSLKKFSRGMGISVKLEFGLDSGTDGFTFNGVGANFVSSPMAQDAP
jgi:hypothetical protein